MKRWVAGAVGLVLGLGTVPAAADEDPQSTHCVLSGAALQSFTVSRTAVNLGESITITWDVRIEPGCEQLIVTLQGQRVDPRGSTVHRPQTTGTVELWVEGWEAPAFPRKLGSHLIQVTVPDLPKHVTINHNDESELFVQAVARPNTIVTIQPHVSLNLSARESIHIARGVQILGNRTSRSPGPQIYSTTDPSALLVIGSKEEPADNVRIRGIRLFGGNLGIEDADGPWPTGLLIISSVNVEVVDSEVYGWSGVGIKVIDPVGRINRENATAVRIAGNFIHHNRHYRRTGYGVSTGESAYALIENNVFDYNRHALESSGVSGTGYLAYRNLVLPEGGENHPWGFDTHMLDVHGTQSCGGKDGWCGQAGQYFDYRYNAIYYDDDEAIRVRGEPTVRTDVTQNIFRSTWHELRPVVVQNEGDNLNLWNNLFGVGTLDQRGSCDFDRDGLADEFLATGITWWFKGLTGWRYLNTSTARLSELTLGDVDGDRVCDVRINAGGKVFSGGARAPQRGELWWRSPDERPQLWRLQPGQILNVVPGFPTGTEMLGAADFNADGVSDVATRNPHAEVQVHLLDFAGNEVPTIAARPTTTGVIPFGVRSAGLGDFNNDKRADMLWRHPDNRLEIWFGGERGNSVFVTYDDAITTPASDWRIERLGDFDADGRSDILWRHDDGRVAISYVDRHRIVSSFSPTWTHPGNDWQIRGLGDFDRDGYSDILWHHQDGALAIWFRGFTGGQAYPTRGNGTNFGTEWQVKGVVDANGDAKSDVVWRHTNGTVVIWYLNGGTYLGESGSKPHPTKYNLFATSHLNQHDLGIRVS